MKNTSQILPSIAALKTQAKRMRTELASRGVGFSHGQVLELLAHQYGFKDWNGLYARAQKNSLLSDLRLGQIVEGQYLGQDIVGEVIAIQKSHTSNCYHLTLELESPIDVVRFDSFSNFRKRIQCRVDEGGMSAEKTSDGQPHMMLKRVG